MHRIKIKSAYFYLITVSWNCFRNTIITVKTILALCLDKFLICRTDQEHYRSVKRVDLTESRAIF